MRNIIFRIGILAILLIVPLMVGGQTVNTLNPWLFESQNSAVVRGNTVNIRVPALGSAGNPCLKVGLTGIISTTTCGGGTETDPIWSSFKNGIPLSSGSSSLVIGGTATSVIAGDGTVSTFGGSINLNYPNTLSINSPVAQLGGISFLEGPNVSSTELFNNAGNLFDFSNANGFVTYFDTSNISSADRTFALPDKSGTFALTSDITTTSPGGSQFDIQLNNPTGTFAGVSNYQINPTITLAPAPPTGLTATQIDGTGSGNYFSDGELWEWRVYSYKDVGSTRLISTTYASTSITDSNSGNDMFFELNYTPDPGADGIVVTQQNAGQTGFAFNVHAFSTDPTCVADGDTGFSSCTDITYLVGLTTTPNSFGPTLKLNDWTQSGNDWTLGAPATISGNNLTINSLYVATSGKIGVGNSAPTATVDVTGGAKISGNTTSTSFQAGDGSVASPSIAFSTQPNVGFSYNTTPAMITSINGTEVARFRNNGMSVGNLGSSCNGGTGLCVTGGMIVASTTGYASILPTRGSLAVEGSMLVGGDVFQPNRGLDVRSALAPSAAGYSAYSLFVRPTFVPTAQGSSITALDVLPGVTLTTSTPVTNMFAANLGLSISGQSTTTNGYGLVINAPVLSGGAVITNQYSLITRGIAKAGLNMNTTEAPSDALSFGENATATISQNRRNVSTGGGSPFTIEGQGVKSGATNATGGDLLLETGIGTGNSSTSSIRFAVASSVGSGTTDQSLVEKMRLTQTGLGIGTTTPSVALDVVGDALFTQAWGQLVETTPGATTGSTITATSSGVFYGWTGASSTVSNSQGIAYVSSTIASGATSTLTIGALGAGTYRISIFGSLSVNAASQQIHVAPFKNGVQVQSATAEMKGSTPGDILDISGGGIVTFAVGDTMDVRVDNESSTGKVITFNHLSLVLTRIGR